MNSTRILSIDAATLTTGYAVVDCTTSSTVLVAWGKIKCKGLMHERLNQLRERVKELIEEYKPDEVAVEDLKFNRSSPNLVSMSKVAFAISAVMIAFAEAKYLEVRSITANSVRKTWAVTQKKAALRDAVNKRFIKAIKDNGRPDGFKTADEDITDAIGLAVAIWPVICKGRRNG